MARRLVVLWAITAVALSSAFADTLHLRAGGKVHADDWWIDGKNVVIETNVGTIRIPSADVAFVETPEGRRPLSVAARGKTVRRPRSRVQAPPREQPGAPPSSLSAPSLPHQPAGSGQGDSVAADLTLKGHEAVEERAYERALTFYVQALAADPTYAPAALSAASVALATGDVATAIDRARWAVHLDGENATSWALLGHALSLQGDLAGAQQALEKSIGLRADTSVQAALDKILRERKAADRFTSFSTPHFRVEYDGQTVPRLGREALRFLEDSFDAMARQFSHYPPGSLSVIFYPRESFHEVTGADGRIAGLYDGKVRVPLGGPDRLTDEVRRVLRHELAHGLIDSKTRGRCPRWLHEGLAQTVEPRTARGLDQQIFRSMGPNPRPTSVAFTYASALSFVEYLQQRNGEAALMTLLDRLAIETDTDRAFRSVYSVGLDELVLEWIAKIGGNARVPGRARGVSR